MKRPRSLHGAAALVAAGLLLLPAGALAGTTDGFMLGLGLGTSHIGAGDSDPTATVVVDETGGGVTLLIGYGFTPSFALRLNVSGAEHQTTKSDADFRIGSGTLEAMYLFRNPEPLRPYLFGGFGGFTMASRRDALEWEVTGPGVVVGGGTVYFLGEHFALDIALRADFINWEEETRTLTFTDGTEAVLQNPVEGEGSTAKLMFAADWWF